MRSACPRGNRAHGVSGRPEHPQVQSACMTVERANLNDQSLNVDIENTVPKVQINRCVVETPNDGVTDRFDVCSPVMLCLDKVNRPVMGDKDNVSVREHKVDHTNNTALSQTQNTPTCVQRTPLTYIHVMIVNAGPGACPILRPSYPLLRSPLCATSALLCRNKDKSSCKASLASLF